MARRLTACEPIPTNVWVELSAVHNKACMLCGQKEISEQLYGKLYQLNDIIVHYFCLLLSNTVQNGSNNEGICGFVLKDIKKEILRGSTETCVYCNEKGATISCCGVKCQKVFHLPCGLKNDSMHQYFLSFKSFCQKHRIPQIIGSSELQNSTPAQCAICKLAVKTSPSPTTIFAPCCDQKYAWFHRECVQDLALGPDDFLKCHICKDDEKLKCKMLILGIYIPSRSLKKLNHKNIDWDTSPYAWEDLMVKHCTCNAVKCLYPFQNQQIPQRDSRAWEIIMCRVCGSNKTHRLCSFLKCSEEWDCVACQAVPDNAKRTTKKRK